MDPESEVSIPEPEPDVVGPEPEPKKRVRKPRASPPAPPAPAPTLAQQPVVDAAFFSGLLRTQRAMEKNARSAKISAMSIV